MKYYILKLYKIAKSKIILVTLKYYIIVNVMVFIIKIFNFTEVLTLIMSGRINFIILFLNFVC